MKQTMKRTTLKTGLIAIGVLATLVAVQAQAQTVYRIVGSDGKITFSDKPPITADKVTATGRNGKPLDLDGSAMPLEVRQAVSKFPVTLYTATNCAPCGSGRGLLTGRGVPFTERTVNTAEDNEALQRISGESSLPFLTIGGQKLKGFSDTEWTQFLDAAGYPSTSKLPGNYRSPPATPLVAVQRPSAPATPPAADTAARAPAAAAAPAGDNSSNPAGIKF